MRSAHTVEQVREAEAALMARLPEGALMQRAAAGLAYAVLDLLGGAYGRRVLLLVGSGDNGGDALYAGAMLARRGCAVEAWLLSDRAHEGGVAALRGAGGRIVRFSVRQGAPSTTRPDVVVDGIVGIGGRGGLREDAAAALRLVAGPPVVAVDTPSGVGVDTGELDGSHVRADVTVTFGTHKIAHLVDPAAAACGVVHLVDIGLELPPAPVEALQPDDVAALLPRPRPDAHKYTRGVVGIRCGSAAYPGAGLLSVAGAATGLCGMVRYVGDRAVADRVREAHPEVVGADALAHVRGRLGVPAVLTPHAGELAAMLGTERADVEAQPLLHARRAADELGAVVLLKGRHTLVAEPEGRVRATTTGVPWLATAGAGDVLGGLLAARRRRDPGLPRRTRRGRRRGPPGGGRRATPPVPRLTALRRPGVD